ncbi:MAG: hypothetical protein HQL70_05010 [Magnetococcales bacterium]|nr:hypothetical protein [Magnetococcales bacterium]
MGADKVLEEKIQEAIVKDVTGEVTKNSVQEMVRAMLPEMAEKIVREEIARIHAEERSVEIDGKHLTAAIKEAFAPEVESMAREMVKEMVADMLPQLAVKMVASEIERIKTAS